MEDNYFWFVNGKGFVRYMDALEYAKQVTLNENKYYAIYSKNEIDAIKMEALKNINHELECGK